MNRVSTHLERVLRDGFLLNNEVNSVCFLINPGIIKYLYTRTYNTRCAKGYQMTIIVHVQQWCMLQWLGEMVYQFKSSNMILFSLFTYRDTFPLSARI